MVFNIFTSDENANHSLYVSGMDMLFSFSHLVISSSDSGGKNHEAFSPYSGASCSHKLTISFISSVKLFLGIFGTFIKHRLILYNFLHLQT